MPLWAAPEDGRLVPDQRWLSLSHWIGDQRMSAENTARQGAGDCPVEKPAWPQGRAEKHWDTVSQATERAPKVFMPSVLDLEKFQVEMCPLGQRHLV